TQRQVGYAVGVNVQLRTFRIAVQGIRAIGIGTVFVGDEVPSPNRIAGPVRVVVIVPAEDSSGKGSAALGCTGLGVGFPEALGSRVKGGIVADLHYIIAAGRNGKFHRSAVQQEACGSGDFYQSTSGSN